MARGTLRIYLGAAPGVGKTYAMLDEAHRRSQRGTDVVVGFVETHGRAHTRDMIGDLEVVPRNKITYRGAMFEEMDVDAVIARNPQVACVDELAHTNVPGSSRHEKRWQDVEDLLAAGITVLSTVNVQHLESVNDVVEKITGVRQQETLPDVIVREADQVELVDVTPEALRRRMAHGNIYPAERIDAALGNYFRVGNLTALRELSLVWLADKVEDALEEYRRDHDIDETWETRERVVVALTGGPEGETLIRRAARIATRGGADLLAVHVVRSDGLAGANPAHLAQQRRLLETLGGEYHEVVGDNVPRALIDFARAENATQLAIGASRRSALASFFTGAGIGATTVRLSGDIDVHMVSHEHAGRGRRPLPRLSGGLNPRRRLSGAVLAAVLLPLVTLGLMHLRSGLNLTSDLLAYLLVVLAVSLVGGVYPGVLTAVAASMLLNYYFTPPIHQWTIAERDNVIALFAFVVVAATTSWVVELAARRTAQAARATAESQTLGTLAGSVLRGEAAVPALLTRLREALSLSTVTLLERSADSRHWTPLAWAGPEPSTSPDDGDASAPGGEDLALVVRGHLPRAEDQRLLAVFAVQAAVALEQQRLAEAAQAAKPLAEADRMRTALLTAVSHDLRSPLSSATAAVESLANDHIAWTPEERAELTDTARESLQHLTRLVENLLDMSRLQAGALAVFPEPTRLDEVVPLALDALGPALDNVDVAIDLPPSIPEVKADPALLERVIANIVANAIRYSPPSHPPRLSASTHRGHVELRVIDHGPGVPEADRERIFTAFQRLGDTDNTTGVGLGLALARGLMEAMGGHLVAEETPGGGLTMVIQLHLAQAPTEQQPTELAAG